MALGGSESRVGRITHESQMREFREAAEGYICDVHDLVVLLFMDGKDGRSEAAVDVVCGGAGRGDEWCLLEARAEWGASRTIFIWARLVQPVKAPSGMALTF